MEMDGKTQDELQRIEQKVDQGFARYADSHAKLEEGMEKLMRFMYQNEEIRDEMKDIRKQLLVHDRQLSNIKGFGAAIAFLITLVNLIIRLI